jgi:hypothetical protein
MDRLYKAYSLERQTFSNLEQRTGISTRTLRRKFDQHTPKIVLPNVSPTPLALTFDATFFGRRYGFMIYRADGKNIHWQEIESETLAIAEEGLRYLTAQGWLFSSVTIDGKKGVISLVKTLFPTMPVQMCLFHQKQIVRRYLTTQPKTRCGKEIQILTSFLIHLDEAFFLDCLADIKLRYEDFLQERHEQKRFKHKKIRSALRSLTFHAPYLYTWKNYPNLEIPPTTNSCDGSFSHWKNKVKIHRGLTPTRRAKMIHFLLANS